MSPIRQSKAERWNRLQGEFKKQAPYPDGKSSPSARAPQVPALEPKPLGVAFPPGPPGRLFGKGPVPAPEPPMNLFCGVRVPVSDPPLLGCLAAVLLLRLRQSRWAYFPPPDPPSGLVGKANAPAPAAAAVRGRPGLFAKHPVSSVDLLWPSSASSSCPRAVRQVEAPAAPALVPAIPLFNANMYVEKPVFSKPPASPLKPDFDKFLDAELEHKQEKVKEQIQELIVYIGPPP